MKIAISGSTGFIGKLLSDFFLQSGNELIMISRLDFAGGSNQLAKVIKSADVILNLAGASVLQRWSEKNKNNIISSRVDTTKLLVKAVKQNLPEHCPRVFISASAIGIYESNKSHDDYSKEFGNDFLASVCKEWESATTEFKEIDLRLCTIRIGIVLGTTGGSLKKMLPIFKAGIGGKISSGNQAFSFIHGSDFCQAIQHLIMSRKSEGVYNFVSPEPSTNKLFTKALSENLHRPAFFTIPEFALKIIYGQAAELLTTGARVLPRRLLEEGFRFQFPDIFTAVADLVNKGE
jgi:uncharacterized protein (TIGR01777 family)